jgi:nucleotide-binding universal stress UspA family protein
MYRRILIPTDGSETATKAVTAGIHLAHALKARLIFLTVTEPLSSLGDRQHAFQHMPEAFRKQALDYLDAAGRRALDLATEAAAGKGVAAEKVLVEASEPYEAIIAAATTQGADLIMMGSHGRRGVQAMLLGSVTHKVLSHTKLPVIVVR